MTFQIFFHYSQTYNTDNYFTVISDDPLRPIDWSQLGVHHTNNENSISLNFSMKLFIPCLSIFIRFLMISLLHSGWDWLALSHTAANDPLFIDFIVHWFSLFIFRFVLIWGQQPLQSCHISLCDQDDARM